ncbi:MAG: glycine cleavage system aminomethyltransferase GcvT [Chitinispirillales bacterium]|jgi:aminomethyltransferase|nr:glycine cleavage system aminomethyltransferase GcvT [Chitinispirillales bacterium]
MPIASGLKKTPLHAIHLSSGAKMAPFSGYDMPMQYGGGILAEHGAARGGAAIFDTCHMGEFAVRGAGAVSSLERALSCGVADLRAGACRYGFICNEGGGVADDMILYRVAESEFMVVVNAGNEDGDFERVKRHMAGDTEIERLSPSTAKVDVQGPKAPKIAAALLRDSVSGLTFYKFMRNYYKGLEVIVSRTGYTGEIGFEVYCPARAVADFWNDCVAGGATPAGLGARDILRLEMGYPLHGHELRADRNAAESGLAHAISAKKEFIGSPKALDPSLRKQSLCGISLSGRRTAHGGDKVLIGGKEAGAVTSGSFSPSLGHAIALAYVDRGFAAVGTELTVACGKNDIAGKVCGLPFYKNGTARGEMDLYL